MYVKEYNRKYVSLNVVSAEQMGLHQCFRMSREGALRASKCTAFKPRQYICCAHLQSFFRLVFVCTYSRRFIVLLIFARGLFIIGGIVYQ